MIEKYLKQYIYTYNVCHFNEIHLEFAEVIFHKHQQKSTRLVYINYFEEHVLYPSHGGHLSFIIFMNISDLET